MSRYRKVDSRIWGDARFKAMSVDARYVFLYLLTHPRQSACGAFTGNIDTLAAEQKWPLARMTSALAEVGTRVVIDDDVVWLPNFLRYNMPENPNTCIAIARGVDDLPESVMRNRVDAAVKACLSQCRQSFINAYVNPGRTVSSDLTESGAGAGAGAGAGTVVPSVVVSPVQREITSISAITAPRANGRAALRGAPHVSEACDDWREIVGGAPPGGEIAGSMTRLLKEAGVTWRLARPVWRWALTWHVSQGRMEFFKPGDFASRFRYWATKAVRGSGKGGLTDMEDAARFLRGEK